MKTILATVSLAICIVANSQYHSPIMPVASDKPNKAQLQQISRKYGMFIHFGINTFHDMEWTDGTLPAASYAPTAIDAEQWIRSAKAAGMTYVILTVKHHDGFCLWNSQFTDYDVAASGNKTDVVDALAKACKKYGVGLGLYYSLWDRNKTPIQKIQHSTPRTTPT